MNEQKYRKVYVDIFALMRHDGSLSNYAKNIDVFTFL